MKKATLKKVEGYASTVLIFALFFGLGCLIAERLDWSLLAVLVTIVTAVATVTVIFTLILQRCYCQALYRGWIGGSVTAFLAFFSLSSRLEIEVPYPYFLIGLFGWVLASLTVILLLRAGNDSITIIKTK